MIADLDIPIFIARGDIPPTWTDIVEVVRSHTGEEPQPNVQANILGTLLAMTEKSSDKLAKVFGVAAQLDPALQAAREGYNNVAQIRDVLAKADPQGAECFDFELVKNISLLSFPQSLYARRSQGRPAPDIWAGDVSRFPLA